MKCAGVAQGVWCDGLATECIAVGHLVAFVLGMQAGCQPADEVQPLLFFMR